MSDGFEASPEAIRALTSAFAEAQQQTDQVRAWLEKPRAGEKDFGRWDDEQFGRDHVEAMGAIAADLANLAKLFGDVQTQLGSTAELLVAGESAQVGTFTTLGSDSGSGTSTEDAGR